MFGFITRTEHDRVVAGATPIQLRRTDPSLAMRDLIPHPFWIAQPVDQSARHAAGDTREEAIANWQRRFGAAEVVA